MLNAWVHDLKGKVPETVCYFPILPLPFCYPHFILTFLTVHNFTSTLTFHHEILPTHLIPHTKNMTTKTDETLTQPL